MRLTVNGVTVMFGGRTVLNVRQAAFETGIVSGIVGPSGSGKSSLLAVIAGVRVPDTGSVQFVTDDDTRKPASTDVAWVPQGAYLLPDRTVLDNVAVGALSEGADLSQARDRAHAALRSVRLEHHSQSRAAVLSGGESQRVALARAICTTRPIVLADEPTASLDRGSASEVAAILDRLRDNRLILVATHDPLLMDQCGAILDLSAA